MELTWRVGYAVCSLIYMVWVVYLSLNNFDLVHRQYRSAQKQLQPKQIEKIALKELVDRCRKESKRIDIPRTKDGAAIAVTDDPCLSWPESVLTERENAVKERLVAEKSRVVRKLAIFYVSFGLIFLILPPVFLYMLLSFAIWIYKSIKFVK
jgi:hypothetical protein